MKNKKLFFINHLVAYRTDEWILCDVSCLNVNKYLTIFFINLSIMLNYSTVKWMKIGSFHDKIQNKIREWCEREAYN